LSTEPNTEATNETGFTAHPGGWINLSGERFPGLEQRFKNSGIVGSDGTKSSDWLGEVAFFWSSTPEMDFLWLWYIGDSALIGDIGSASHYAFSVRCLKD